MNAAHKNYDELFKVVISGGSGSGKTCLLTRYTSSYFEEKIISVKKKKKKINNLYMK